MKLSSKVLIKCKRFGKILYLVLSDSTTEVGVAIKFTLCKITIPNDIYRRIRKRPNSHKTQLLYFFKMFKIYMLSKFNNFNYSFDFLHRYSESIYILNTTTSLIMQWSYFYHSIIDWKSAYPLIRLVYGFFLNFVWKWAIRPMPHIGICPEKYGSCL